LNTFEVEIDNTNWLKLEELIPTVPAPITTTTTTTTTTATLPHIT
jgi:hypothetical protein